MALFNWIKAATGKLIDPNRDVVLKDQRRRVEQHLYQNPDAFDLNQACAACGILPEDVPPIAHEIYHRAATKAWADEVVTDRERKSLNRLARLLHIAPGAQRDLELIHGLAVFDRAMTEAVADGVLDDTDGARLQSVRRVINVRQTSHGVEVSCSGRGAGFYHTSDVPLVHAITATAVGRANQTIVDASANRPTRFIPRDVRQRVWQAYGGRCADCGATQYLEFDHFIPFAKGGSSEERNVQLLCRGCNGKKSDHL